MRARLAIRRTIDFAVRIFRTSDTARPVVRHNAVLAKWEQYYETHPTALAQQRRYSTLKYLTPAD